MYRTKSFFIFLIKMFFSNSLFLYLLILFFNYFIFRKISKKNNTIICNVLGHDQVGMFIISQLSFSFFSQLKLPILLINDGTLTNNDKKLLNYLSVKIIEQAAINKIIFKQLGNNSYFAKYLLKKGLAVSKYKLTFPFLSDKKILILEGDILFFDRPSEIIEWITNSSKAKQVLYMQHIFAKHIDLNSIDPELVIRNLIGKALGIKFDKHLNNGLICYHKSNFDFKVLEKVVKLFIDSGYEDFFSSEETLYAILIKNSKVADPLDGRKYLVNTFGYEVKCVNKKEIIARHYAFKSKPFFYFGVVRFLMKVVMSIFI